MFFNARTYLENTIYSGTLIRSSTGQRNVAIKESIN